MADDARDCKPCGRAIPGGRSGVAENVGCRRGREFSRTMEKNSGAEAVGRFVMLLVDELPAGTFDFPFMVQALFSFRAPRKVSGLETALQSRQGTTKLCAIFSCILCRARSSQSLRIVPHCDQSYARIPRFSQRCGEHHQSGARGGPIVRLRNS